MGLDMYLKAEKYIGGWDHSSDAEKKQYARLLRFAGLKRKQVAKDSPSGTVLINVAYWRKAYAIHGWFVRNCQDGKGECQTQYVRCEQLSELVEACKNVLADNSKAEELLPRARDCFFGSNMMDESYVTDLKNTIEQLTPLLADNFTGFDFYYHSSW